MILAQPIAVAIQVAKAFDDLQIHYVVGGSLASSTHGIPRVTEDVDLFVWLTGSLVEALVVRLESEFFVDRDLALDAVMHLGSFDLLHRATRFELDLFVSDRSDMSTLEMQRAKVIGLGDPAYPLRICSPEDIVLQKLDWYERDGRASDRHWHDLVGVLAVQARNIDKAYISRWAKVMGSDALLKQALLEAGLV